MGKGTRYPEIEKLLNKKDNGGRVLEIGAGAGKYSHIFTNYIGSDLPTSEYSEGEKLELYCDARYMPFKKDSFDLVFGVATFYLIENISEVFDNIWQILKPEGMLLLLDYTERTQIKIRRRYFHYGQEGHFSFWTLSELKRLLNHSGFGKIKKLLLYAPIIELARFIFRRPKRWLVVQARKKTYSQ